MQTQEVAVKPNLKVVMRGNAEALDEVVVIAYGTAKKESLTGSISVVDNKKELHLLHTEDLKHLTPMYRNRGCESRELVPVRHRYYLLVRPVRHLQARRSHWL